MYANYASARNAQRARDGVDGVNLSQSGMRTKQPAIRRTVASPHPVAAQTALQAQDTHRRRGLAGRRQPISEWHANQAASHTSHSGVAASRGCTDGPASTGPASPEGFSSVTPCSSYGGA